ncbi:MAG TPA: TRAP transporter substrate-binding protein, partial [Burkholderiaceae bacterium]|nr:TRAP transporter substrate-binding protein [Burkholderiaceae bacterium]
MKTLIKTFGAAVIGLALTGTVHAADKQVIKLGWTTTNNEQDPFGVGARAFKKALEEHPDGQMFDVQFYPNRQLGDEKALVEGVRMGMADAGLITNAVLAQTEPAFLLNDLPFLYPSSEKAFELMDGAVGQQMAEKLEKKGVVLLSYMGAGFRHMLNNVRPVSTPDDVKGVKYRVMQSPIYIGMYESLGGSPVPMEWGETYTAIQQGALDGMELPLAVADATKSYEVTKYLSLTNHTFTVIDFIFNKRKLDSYEPAQKQAILDAARDAAVEQRRITAEIIDTLTGTLAEKGMEVNEISDPASFREKVTPVYEEFRDRIGSDLL